MSKPASPCLPAFPYAVDPKCVTVLCLVPPNKSEVYDILPGRQAEGLVWVKLPGDEDEASLEAANE